MALNNIQNGPRNAQCDAFVDLIDSGTTDTGGDLQIHSAAFATLLAEPEFGNPAFGAAAAGIATANAITDEAAAPATGTAAVLRIRDRDNTQMADGSVGVTGSGEDLELNTVSITTNDVVSITAATITAPAA